MCVCVCVCGLGVAISRVAVAAAELAALMHHGIILDRCCYLCSVSKPIILTQIYVNTAVSWHRKRFTHTQGGRELKVLFSLALPQRAQCINPTWEMCFRIPETVTSRSERERDDN